MQRAALVTLATLAFAATTMVFAQDEKKDPSSFTVKCVLSGAETESIENETLVIKEAVATGIPIRQTVKRENGPTVSWTALRFYVPSPALMANADPEGDAESIPVGPQLTCRIQRASNRMLLLDATLADTVSKRHDPQGGILAVVTRQFRSVQPVRLGQSVTLSWPADESHETPRQVTITILDIK